MTSGSISLFMTNLRWEPPTAALKRTHGCCIYGDPRPADRIVLDRRCGSRSAGQIDRRTGFRVRQLRAAARTARPRSRAELARVARALSTLQGPDRHRTVG